MNSNDILYFDSRAAVNIRPEWDWKVDKFPPLTSLVWKWKGKTYLAESEQSLAEFVDCCYDAPFLVGFNCHASVSLVKAEILSVFGREYYEEMAVGEALHKRKRIDLMLSTKKWVDARAVDGRLRNPSIAELYSRCFPVQPLPKDDTISTVKTLEQCLPRVLLEGLTELKEREYRENGPISQL